MSERPYYVVSEEHITYRSCSEPPEPPEYGCDVYEVFASNKREAVIAGVQIALQQNRSYALDNRRDGINPFAGYHAELAVCPHGRDHFMIVEGRVVYPDDCPECNAEHAALLKEE